MASRSLRVLSVQRIRGNSFCQASGHAKLLEGHKWLRPGSCPSAATSWNLSQRRFASEAASSSEDAAAAEAEASDKEEAATAEGSGSSSDSSSSSDSDRDSDSKAKASSAPDKSSEADGTSKETSTEPGPDSSADHATFTPHWGDAPPAPWRHAGEWVDLELERVGLPSHSSVQSLKSPWGGEDLPPPDMNVLWPHAALNEHRSRPFMLPRQRVAGRGKNKEEPGVDGGDAQGQLQANRERLTSLWRMSASHGISWDELDAAYVSFAKTGKKRFAEWSKSSEDKLPKAVIMKQKSKEYAERYLRRFCTSSDQSPTDRWPSRTRRLASRKYVEEKRRFLGPWAPGRLTSKLQQLVAAKMLRRETEERVLGLKQ